MGEGGKGVKEGGGSRCQEVTTGRMSPGGAAGNESPTGDEGHRLLRGGAVGGWKLARWAEHVRDLLIT